MDFRKNGIKQYKESNCFDVNSTKYKFLNARNKELANTGFKPLFKAK